MLSRDNKIFSLENQSFSSRRVIFILWKRFVIRRSLSFIILLIGLRHFLEYAAWSGWYLPKMKGTTAFVSFAAILTFEIASLLRNGISHAATKLYSDEAWKRPVYIPPRLPEQAYCPLDNTLTANINKGLIETHSPVFTTRKDYACHVLFSSEFIVCSSEIFTTNSELPTQNYITLPPYV